MPCSRPPQVGPGVGRNCITSGQVHGSKAGSDLWALSQELLNELNLNPRPMHWPPWVEILWLWALVSQAVKWGVYLFLSLLRALDQMGHLTNVAWCLAQRCSQTSGINTSRSARMNICITTAFLLGSAQEAQDPDTIGELFGSVITVCFCSFLGLHSPAQYWSTFCRLCLF